MIYREREEKEEEPPLLLLAITSGIPKTLINFTLQSKAKQSTAAMTDLMTPSKRQRAPSFSECSVSDWFAEKEIAQVIDQVKSFLELCRFCKKQLRQDQDVFMYGILGAFCSKACRKKQMACDIFRELPQAKKGRTCGKTKPKQQSKDEGLETTTASSSRFYI